MQTPSIRVCTLGGVSLTDAAGTQLPSVTAQPRRVALLVYLTVAQQRGFHTRDSLVALFWPDYDESRARNALSQAVHFLRRALGAETILSSADDQLRVDPALVSCDALSFEAAIEAATIEEALELYRGPFLDGFYIAAAAAELEQWVDGERDRLARLYAHALEEMATRREAAGDFGGAVRWRRQLATQDPLSSRWALALIRTLAAAGERELALQHARIHEALVRQELDAPPDPAITAFVSELRTTSAPSARKPASAPSLTSEAPAPSVAATSETPPTKSTVARNGRRNRTLIAAGGLLAASLAFVPIVSRKRADVAPRLQCVAVLPIENLSADTALHYVAAELTEATRTELARYEEPRVISPTSALAFRRSTKPLPEIGRDLNCDGIVEGSLTRSGRVAHVDAQILYAPGDRHLWAESFEADTSEMLRLERRVTDAVARHARLLAGKGPATTLPERGVNPVAYGLYVNGRNAFRSRNKAAISLAVELYRQAISLDSTFALAYAALADAYGFVGGYGYGSITYLDSARSLVERALVLDSMSSEAHTSKATIFINDGDFARADAEFRRAIELGPNNALAHHWYAMMLAVLNSKEEAVEHIRIARELDPLSQPIQGMRIAIQFFAGVKEDLGHPATVKGMVDPMHAGTHAARGLQLARKGRCAEAYDANKTAQQLAPDNTMILIALVGVQTLCKEPGRAHTLLEQVKRRPDAALQAVYIATIYAQTRQPDSAFAWLDRSRWSLQSYFELRTNGSLQPLRSDPRYALLLQRLHIPL